MGKSSWKGASPYITVAVLFVLGVTVNAILSSCAPKTTPEAVAADQYRLASFKCADCHEMWPYISTWMLSVHNKIRCDSCHTRIDLQAMAEAHAAGTWQQPIALKSPMDGGICLSCHSGRRVPSMPGDLRDPHPIHARAGVDCLACHYGVTHFKVAERNLFQRPEWSNGYNWRPELVQTIATLPYSRPNMHEDCFTCHQTVAVAQQPVDLKGTACAGCHGSAVKVTPCAACHFHFTGTTPVAR
ncbi:hypothetical protein [Desulfothermobacter acidiphilus]|uniref:hypothetical protein n=1 Tax=Desulfothermobacter acidiphilus TaxID=1938353 RepID=UPI003F8B0C3C